MNRSAAKSLALDLSFGLSRRLMSVAAAILTLMAAQLAAASCTPEPTPYAARVAIQR